MILKKNFTCKVETIDVHLSSETEGDFEWKSAIESDFPTDSAYISFEGTFIRDTVEVDLGLVSQSSILGSVLSPGYSGSLVVALPEIGEDSCCFLLNGKKIGCILLNLEYRFVRVVRKNETEFSLVLQNAPSFYE